MKLSLWMAAYTGVASLVSLVALFAGDLRWIAVALIAPIFVMALYFVVASLRRLPDPGELSAAATFTDDNPNPVLRIGRSGEIIYANNEGRILLAGLNNKSNPAPVNLTEMMNSALESKRSVRRTTSAGDNVYELVFSPDVESKHVNVYGTDITSLYLATEALSESESRLRTIVTGIPIVLFATDVTGVITLSEGKALEAIGSYPGKIVGDSVFDMYRDRPSLLNDFRKALAGETLITEIEATNGMMFDTTLSPLTNDDGAITGMIGVSINVTERKEAEADRLRLSEQRKQTERERERLTSIINASHDLIAMMELDGTIIYMNSAGIKMLGLTSSSDIVGNHISMLYGDRDRELIQQSGFSYVFANEIWRDEGKIIRKDGISIPVDQTIFLLRDAEGNPQSIAAILRDITDRKLQESAVSEARDQALEASRLKSEFLATVSHEIRTPMNGIIGMTELLLSTALSNEQREFTQVVYDEAYSLLRIINDILDFSKIEAGKVILEHTDFSPLVLAESVAELFAPETKRKDIELMVYVDSDVPSALIGDVGRVRQILVNLVSNAVKFTKKGEVAIHVTTKPVDIVGAKLRFEVHDTGIGLTPEARRRLFQPFTQADGSTTREYGGTGLGLMICKRLVELMHGEIGVDSNTQAGSRFWFEIGFDYPRPSMTRQLVDGQDLSNLRILIVEDNVKYAWIIEQYLSLWSIRSEIVYSCEAAIAALHQAKSSHDDFRMVLMDGALLDGGAFDLKNAILNDPDFRQIALILMIAFDESDVGKQSLEKGFSAYLTKPMKQGQLLSAIKTAATQVTVNPSTDVSRQKRPRPEASSGLILLAEDNEANRTVASKQLTRLGYEVDTAENGREAIELMQSTDYTLILMDCQMPVMDGFQATRIIREQESENGQHIPIIAMTANALHGDREKCISAGMDDYISKPVTMAQLRALLENWIE